jgi:hypothetical protein
MVTEIKQVDSALVEATKEFITGVNTFMRITGMFDKPLIAIENQHKQLEEEAHELFLAYVSDDTLEVLDGIGDCVFVDVSIDLLKEHLQHYVPPCKALYTFRGLMYTIEPTDALTSACLGAVVVSNLSKFDQSQDEVSLTEAHYFALGVEVESLYDEESNLWYVKVTKDCTDINGKFYHSGKVLKSVVNYREPDFSSILEALDGESA